MVEFAFKRVVGRYFIAKTFFLPQGEQKIGHNCHRQKKLSNFKGTEISMRRKGSRSTKKLDKNDQIHEILTHIPREKFRCLNI